MIENIEWFVRFFTYSSIQVKFIATFIAVFLFFIIRKIYRERHTGDRN